MCGGSLAEQLFVFVLQCASQPTNCARVVAIIYDVINACLLRSQFNISGPDENYKLSVSGYDGDAGNNDIIISILHHS